jgi:hypothetical protein
VENLIRLRHKKGRGGGGGGWGDLESLKFIYSTFSAFSFAIKYLWFPKRWWELIGGATHC